MNEYSKQDRWTNPWGDGGICKVIGYLEKSAYLDEEEEDGKVRLKVYVNPEMVERNFFAKPKNGFKTGPRFMYPTEEEFLGQSENLGDFDKVIHTKFKV